MTPAQSDEVLVVMAVSVKSGIALQIGNKYQIVTSQPCSKARQGGSKLGWATNQMLGPRASPSLQSATCHSSSTSTTLRVRSGDQWCSVTTLLCKLTSLCQQLYYRLQRRLINYRSIIPGFGGLWGRGGRGGRVKIELFI